MNRELHTTTYFFHASAFTLFPSIDTHLHLQSPDDGQKVTVPECITPSSDWQETCWKQVAGIDEMPPRVPSRNWRRTLWKLLDVSNWTPRMINDRCADCCGRNIYPIWIPNLAFVQNVPHRHHGLTWSVSMMSASSFSDILRMEAAMDLALIIDLAERPPFAATALACFNLLLLISCCLTSWTSKSISLARAWRGWRRRNEKEKRRMMKWVLKKQGG